MSIAGYILAGGKNTRMHGQKKLFLEYKHKTFLTHIAGALKGIGVVYLSVEEKEPYEDTGYPCIVDVVQDIGPMGGIYTGLKTCKEDALLVVSCDTPKVTKEIVEALISWYDKGKRPVIIWEKGRYHPLIGIYTKEMLPVMEVMIREGNYRMMSLLKHTGFETLELAKEDGGCVSNVNDSAAYNILQEE